MRDSTFSLVYKYQAKQDFIGEDKVQIVLLSGSNGSGSSTNSKYIISNITVKE